jgi:hypothetical protein
LWNVVILLSVAYALNYYYVALTTVVVGPFAGLSSGQRNIGFVYPITPFLAALGVSWYLARLLPSQQATPRQAATA